MKFLTSIILFLNIGTAFSNELHHYEVEISPKKIAVGQAVDLTIKAVDKDNNVITDYEGSILIFSESDKLAQFPETIEENSYKFLTSNKGVVKFENAIKFTKPGKHDIHVYDLDDQTDSIFGLAEIEVYEEKIQEKVDIEILTPANGITIGSKKINISGKSKKNHQIKIVLNNKEEILTTTNKDGIFEKEIDFLENGENLIKAYILDSNSEEIGASNEVLIKSDSSLPIFNKLKLIPKGEVEAGRKILIEVYSTKGLSEVSLLINDSINILKEDTNGVYKGEILAPNEEGKYKIDIILKNELGTKVEKKEIEILSIIPKVASADEITKVIKKDKCPNGDFTGDVFDGKCGEKAENYNSPIDLGIRNLKIVQLKTKSVLTWNNLEDAIKYEVYKKMSDGTLEKIDTVTEPKYEIAITGENIKYEYFAVKAIGKQELSDTKDNTNKIEKEIEGDLSDAIKIKTGPTEIIIVFIALLLGFLMLFIGRKNIEQIKN